MKKVSARHRAAVKDAAEINREYLARNPYCHHCLELRRKGSRVLTANVVHHTAGKEGEMRYDTRFFMAVNDACHIMNTGSIHQDVKRSRSRGWLLPRGAALGVKLSMLREIRGHFPWVKRELENQNEGSG